MEKMRFIESCKTGSGFWKISTLLINITLKSREGGIADKEITNVEFADESNWNDGRYRSVAVVSLPIEKVKDIENEIVTLLDNNKELKWSYIKNERAKETAVKILDIILKYVVQRQLVIDVLIWDTQDSRHNVVGRDDIANLQRMYYHILSNVTKKRWGGSGIWQIHPDEHGAMDWRTVENSIKNQAKKYRNNVAKTFFEFLQKNLEIVNVEPLSSKRAPLIQIADIFAGMAAFSYTKYEDYVNWLARKKYDTALFEENKPYEISKALMTKFEFLEYFHKKCKGNKLGVSLRTFKGLRTKDRKKPINFWFYEPQHKRDKAPRKVKKQPS